MPYLFIIKICFTIKVNSICGAGRDTRNLCHKFSYKGSALRIFGSQRHKSQFQGIQFQGPGCQGLMSQVLGCQGPRFPGYRVSEFWVSRSQGFQVSGLRVPGLKLSEPGFRVSGPDFRLCQHRQYAEAFYLFLKSIYYWRSFQ